MNALFIFLCIFANALTIMSFPKEDYHSKGRSWEYGSKIKHPAHHGYHHKVDDGKGWVHSHDSGDQHKGYDFHDNHDSYDKNDIKHDIPIHIPVHIPVHIPKYEHELGPALPVHHYPEPKPYYPEPKHIFPEPKHEKKYEKKDDFSDIGVDVNVDGIIDDIQKDLKKTSNYGSKA